jgi:hypothetical protein
LYLSGLADLVGPGYLWDLLFQSDRLGLPDLACLWDQSYLVDPYHPEDLEDLAFPWDLADRSRLPDLGFLSGQWYPEDPYHPEDLGGRSDPLVPAFPGDQ